MSPRPGSSTLITSAPIQASSWVPVGPAWTCVMSRMRTPSSAFPLIRRLLTQKIPVFFDMCRKAQRVLAGQARRRLGVAPFERLDDRHVIDDRARRAIVLRDRHL